MEKDIILVLAGFFVGAMNAIAGGGMLIGFPILVALGLPPLIANATGSLVTAPGQLTSAIGYRKYLRKVPWKYAILLFPVAFGAAIGAITLRSTPAAHFAKLVPVLVLFGVALFTFQPLLHFHLHKHLTKRQQKWAPLFFIGIAILPISFYGGYFGAGYGFMMLAFLGLTNLHDTHMMNAMKNVSAIVLASVSIACLYSSHLIDWRYGIVMGIGSTIGGYSGSRIAQKVSTHWLRMIIIYIGCAAVVYLALHEYQS
jgi:uncharacterized membrane protein YfcA